MKKLKLPIIKGKEIPAKRLSSDEYIKFVTDNLKYSSEDDREKARAFSDKTAVYVRFKLLD